MPKKSLKGTPTNLDGKKLQKMVTQEGIKGVPSNYDVAAVNKLKPKRRNNKVKRRGPR